ncbi:MAG: RNA polymerase factor sigma-54 [Anaerovoracaceae bacterium]
MKLGYDLTISQEQKLVMTPELIQAIKILQYNTQELNSYVQEQLLSNPVLESTTGEDSDSSKKDDALAEYLEDYGYGKGNKDSNYDGSSYDGSDEDNSYEKYVAAGVSLQEHLSFQLQFAIKDKGLRRVGKFIIESLDDNGYMTLSISDVSKLLKVKEDVVGDVVEVIQNFDPIGICATSLADCLKRQMEQRGILSYEAETVLDNYMDQLAENKLTAIAKKLNITVMQVQEIRDEIKKLEPRPGLQFAPKSETRYIVPDIIVKEINGEYVVISNDNSMPRLMVSSYYEKLLKQEKTDTQLIEYLTERVDSAVWLMRSIEQRKQTILNVAKTIVKKQQEFFKNGEKFLKTMTLKDVSEELEIHESTVSRTINGKYLDCHRGMFELKYFFSAGVQSQGENISSKSVKSHIKDLVDSEDPKSPLSDQKIVNILVERGMDISRRTVAKYRDELNIPSSSKRKRY